MNTNTLPVGWSGNDTDHHIDVGVIRIRVDRPYSDVVTWTALQRRKQPRLTHYRYSVLVGGNRVATADGFNSAAKARDVAWSRVVETLRGMLREVEAMRSAAVETTATVHLAPEDER